MTDDQIKTLAKNHGCKPFYSDLYQAYVCGCSDNRHGINRLCSRLTEKSIRAGGRAPRLTRKITLKSATEIGSVSEPRGKALHIAADRWGAAALILCKR